MWMTRALMLAEKGAGFTSPNPLVGCVIVDRQGDVIGEGYHTAYGRPHAEIEALRSVKDSSRMQGATVYVTLEPCSHQGKTPPCTLALLEHPIARVVIGMKDPNPGVKGDGASVLREKGILVDIGVLSAECEALNRDWLHHLESGLPFLTLKIAQTADGYIADAKGKSRWITGEDARTQVHLWRSRMDAVMVGRSTVLLDNPSLTVRHVEGRQPRRVVLDGPLELPRERNVFTDAYEEKTLLFTWNDKKAAELHDPLMKMLQSNYFRGEVVIVPKHSDGHLDLAAVLKELGARGITSLLVEGGQQLSSALLRRNLVDRLELFIAPKLLGEGTRSLLGIGVEDLDQSGRFRSVEWTPFGRDMLLSITL